MKWVTHQTGALIAAMALELPLPCIAAACAGAIAPDLVDQKISGLAQGKRKRQKAFNKIHRGASHWFGWWLAFFMAALLLPLPAFANSICAGIAFGGLSHVMLDMLTPRGVPLLPVATGFRLSLRICSTGRWSEYVFLGAMITAAVIFMNNPLGEGLRQLIH